MKLIVKRNQADQKGFFGGHKGVNFVLYGRAELSSDERAMIERYKVGDYVLGECEVRPKGGESTKVTISVNDIANGKTVEAGSVNTLRELEDTIKTGCQNLKALLELMATFGGEEVFEI
jgi:hypothetical protein